MSRKRTRIETGYRHIKSEDGSYSPHISKKTNARIDRYCRVLNINKKNFVEDCCNQRLDDLEKEMLQALQKDELIDMLVEYMNRK